MQSQEQPELLSVPRRRGTYALLLQLKPGKEIVVGRLGTFFFPEGYYAYVGSAFGPGGLAARVARHCRHQKKLFWHIDYVLADAQVLDLFYDLSGQPLECVWAGALQHMPGARIIAPGFGASDCRCSSHLVFLGNERSPHWGHLCHILATMSAGVSE